MSQKTEKPGEGATFPSQFNQTREEIMNDRTNNIIRAELQNLTIIELSTFATATRRMLETLEGIAAVPRCRDSEAVSGLLDDELDRLGGRLDLIAAELIKRTPGTESETSERHFALLASACANRLSFEELVAYYQSKEAGA